MRVMSVGDSMYASTGYGTLWNNLIKRWTKLKPDWEFFHQSWQSTDRPYKNGEGVTVLPRAGCNYGSDILAGHLVKFNPDILITLADVGVIGLFVKALKKAKEEGWKGKWVSATNIDSHTWEGFEWNRVLSFPDYHLGLSEWTTIMLKDHGIENVSYIPHGVDINVYKPTDKKKAKLGYNIFGKFVVGFVGRNQRRKMITKLIQGFSQFSKDKDDVLLLMHTDKNPTHGGYGWYLDCLINKYSQYDKDLINKAQTIFPNTDVLMRQNITPEEMTKYYNLMDVFCFPTGGEGFGLPAIEAQSCGVPLMMSAYTTGFELTDKHGVRIPVLKDKYDRIVTEVGTNGIENCVPDDIELANQLNKMYSIWKEGKLNQLGDLARQFSLNYDWDKIAPQFIEYFKTL